MKPRKNIVFKMRIKKFNSVQDFPATKDLPLATAGSWVDVPSRGVDRSESTLLGMGRVTGEVFRVYSKPF